MIARTCAVCSSPLPPVRRRTCSPSCRAIFDAVPSGARVHYGHDLAEWWRRSVHTGLDGLLSKFQPRKP